MDIDLTLIQEMLEKLKDEYGDCSLRIFRDCSGYVVNEDDDILYDFDGGDDLLDLCNQIVNNEDDLYDFEEE